MKHILMVGTALLSATALTASAESLLDSFHGNRAVANEVSEGTRTETRDVSLMAEQTMIKTGGGELVLPEAVQGAGPLNASVAEGTLTLTDDGSASPAVELPQALRDKAQLWLSVKDENAAHLVAGPAAGEVERWYDVRETNVEAPSYGYAVAERWAGAGAPRLGTAEYVTLWQTVTNKLYSLNFGGYGSGCAMLLYKADGTQMTHQPCECFAVQGVINSFGNIFGEASNYPSEIGIQLNIKESGSAATLNRGLGGWASCWGPSKGDAAGWIDGVRTDQAVPIARGFHLLDYRRNNFPINDYYMDRFPIALYSSYSKSDDPAWIPNGTATKGGDYLSEIIYFAQPLTDVERAQVTAYLMAKWFGKASVPKDVWIAAGATLKADVPAGTVADLDVQARGAGTFVKSGEGTLLLKSSKADAQQEAEIDLQAGEIVQSGTAPFRMSSGERLTATTLPEEGAGPYGSNSVARASDAGAGRFVKDGNGAIAVSSVPADVTTVSVAGGELAFRPGADAHGAFVRKEVFVPNHSFEEWTSGFDTPEMAAINIGWYPDSTSFLKEWAVHGGTAYTYDYYRWKELGYASHMSNLSIETYELQNLPPRNGTRMVMLVGGSSLKFDTTITIVEAGEYELSADICGRPGSVNNFFVAQLEDTDGKLVQEIGKFTLMFKDFMTRQAVRTMIASPGTYRLVFRVPGSNASLCFDDIHLDQVGPYAAEYKIPYGDFEGTSLYSNQQPSMLADATALPGWTFDPETVDGYPKVGIVNPNASTLGGHLAGNGYNASREPLGGQYQLLLRAAPSVASVTFTPPAGKWYLSAAVGNWRDTTKGRLTATATVGGQTVTLGTFEQNPKNLRMMYEKVWPVPFVADGSEVTVTLSYALSDGTTDTQGVHIDDVKLVTAYADDREFLINGDFEKDEVLYVRGALGGGGQFRYYGRDDWAFGTGHGKGSCFCELSGDGGFYFDAQLPHAGWYDLSFSAKARVGDHLTAAPVAVSVVHGGVTNLLHTFAAADFSRGVFSRHRIGFAASEPGDYRVIFVGATEDVGAATDFDDCSLRFAGASCDFEMSEDTEIEIAKDARLVLDFPGTKRVKAVRINGHEKHGVIGPQKSAAISGEGFLFVEPVGMSVIIK